MTDTQKLAAPMTVVTAYFQIEDPFRNRAARDYHQWMANLLPFINWPMVVFCDEQSVDIIKRLRGGKPTVIHVTRLEELSAWRHREILHAHNAQRDPGYDADLLLIYHEKPHFMRRAVDENTYHSETFLWCDIGLMRVIPGDHRFMPRVMRLSERIEWPNLQAWRAAAGDKIVFFGGEMSPPPPPRASRFILAMGRNFWRPGRADTAIL